MAVGPREPGPGRGLAAVSGRVGLGRPRRGVTAERNGAKGTGRLSASRPLCENSPSRRGRCDVCPLTCLSACSPIPNPAFSPLSFRFPAKTGGLVSGCAESAIYDLGFCRLKVPNPRILPEKTIPNPSVLTENLLDLSKTRGLVSRYVGLSIRELGFCWMRAQNPRFRLEK